MVQTRRISEYKRRCIAASQSWKCNVCMSSLSAVFQIDHIVPFSLSKNSDSSNLQAVCPNCHAAKSASETKHLYEYNKKKKEINNNDHLQICTFCLAIVTSHFADSHMCIDIDTSNPPP
jgi:5-methylcytosine-specific restriction endonuclease McrA